MYNDEVIKYKKKAKKKVPKKAKHKHEFADCVFEYNMKSYDREKGFVVKPIGQDFGGYCVICGRIHRGIGLGGLTNWYTKTLYGASVCYKLSDEAKKELDPKTRTLPTFWVDDYFNQKFVDLDAKKDPAILGGILKE